MFVTDNECYQSIGGIPTATAAGADLAALAGAAGVRVTRTLRSLSELKPTAAAVFALAGPAYVVCKLEDGREVPVLTYAGPDVYCIRRQ